MKARDNVMKIVTTYGGLQERFSIEKIIEMLAGAGFDAIDFDDIPVETEVWQDSYRDYARHLKNVAQSFGIGFSQAHAPIVSSILSKYSGNLSLAVDRIKRSIEFAALLGAENIVVHPIQDPKFATQSEQIFEKNMNFFSQFVPVAEDCGIKIAIENMVMATLDGMGKRDGVCADPSEFKRYIDSLGSKNVTGCLDFGHSALAGREPQDMLRAMGSDYITSVHIHDNDFIHDSHQLPCTMRMDWDEICKAMADIGYSGDFTLESVLFYNKMPDDAIGDALRLMYTVSKSLVDKIERYRQSK